MGAEGIKAQDLMEYTIQLGSKPSSMHVIIYDRCVALTTNPERRRYSIVVDNGKVAYFPDISVDSLANAVVADIKSQKRTVLSQEEIISQNRKVLEEVVANIRVVANIMGRI